MARTKTRTRGKSRKQSSSDVAPHLVITARAGTGKTTTLIGALQVLRGQQPVTVRHLPGGARSTVPIIPSAQQQLIWDAVAASKAASVCFVAFNKSIATELQQRVPGDCSAMTMHSMGFRALQAARGKLRVTEYRVQDLISEMEKRDIRELRRTEWDAIKAAQELVGLCKMNLVHPWDSDGPDHFAERLDSLVSHYDVEMNGDRARVYDLVARLLERCKDTSDRKCDFNDMIWLPVALRLPMVRYDLLLVDEAQDLNRCQQALARMAGERLVLCGDPCQAIYGFAGADAESMPRMFAELQHTPRGCQELQLTVTRRCGKAIVERASRIVPDFSAHETCGEGLVLEMPFQDKPPLDSYVKSVQPGDFILCRVNAPLVSQCFRFLKEGRKATIQGRDVGQGLISTIKKLNRKNSDISALVGALSEWHHEEVRKEQAKRNPSEQRIISLQDRYECLQCFCEDASTVEEVISRIESVFSDSASEIKLSSIHKAKGLEARRVFFLMPPGAGCPHPMAKSDWQRAQERNLLYVGITRAIDELVFVT